MFGIFLSAINAALGFVLRSVIAKFFLFFGLFFVTTEFVQVLLASGILPSASGLSSAFGAIPSSVWYWLELFNVGSGLQLILSAMATRFIIRRIPVIG
jgi:Protein of unknown function (DUF2523)